MIDFDALKWLDDNDLSYQIWDKKYRRNNETLEQWFDRVSAGNERIKNLIKEKKFIFGGRTLANRGIEDSGSYSNCYSVGYVEDTLEAILRTNTDIAKTFCAHGGQGLSLSKIRPFGSTIKNTYTTDGIVPFMKMFNATTETISQGGSRKGALMMSLDVWHPEIENFITIKSNKNEITKANLSVEIDDEFMRCVTDGVTKLDKVFVYNRLDSSTGKCELKEFNYTVNPVAIFDLICENALKHAEPGVLFTNPLRNYNMMEFVDSYQIETTNPCGEQPLPKHGACNLASINLGEYILNPFTPEARIDFAALTKDIPVMVEVMDDVLEENIERHALEEQRQMARDYRNIGIGVMGVADMLAKLQLTYGEAESIVTITDLMKHIFRIAVLSSAILAEDRGSFPKYDEKMWESNIIKNAFDENEIKFLRKSGLRNATLLSIAPTGSIGTMFGASTGIEPFFRLSYVRTTKSLGGVDQDHKCEIKTLKEYRELTGKDLTPYYFVTSDKIHYNDRIDVQSAFQQFCDTGISSTINLPKGTTLNDIKDLYLKAYRAKLKGVTIYVDGSREGILTENGNKQKVVREINNSTKRPKQLSAQYYPIKVKGENFAVILGYLEDQPYELFTIRPDKVYSQHEGTITKVKKGVYKFESDVVVLDNILDTNISDEEKSTSLYVSMLLRHNVDIKHIVKTTRKTSDSIVSFASAICRVLDKYVAKETLKDTCPNCGGQLVREGGCIHCEKCEYSKCGD